MADYDLELLLQRIPQDRAELFIGFSPWPEDCQNWRRSVNEDHQETPDRRMRRTVWDDPEVHQSRMMIDVIELPSADLAIRTLAETLHWNQLAKLPAGPDGLGYVSFVHPDGVPPAAFIVQGNLFLSIASVGTTPLDVIEWGSRLVERLVERPKDARSGVRLGVDIGKLVPGEPARLSYDLPTAQGEYAFVKILADGAQLSRDDVSTILTATRAGLVTVDLFVVESGREALTGRIEADVR